MLLFSVLVLSIVSFTAAQVGQSCTIRGTGAPGVCTLPNDCKAELKPGQTICEWNGNVPIICCEGAGGASVQKGPTDTRGSQANSRLSLSERKCKEYRKASEDKEIISFSVAAVPVSANLTDCDQGDSPFIVGGTFAALGELPYMVALGFKNGDEIEWNCGGTLISDQYVLTAAHCSDTSNIGPPVVVRLGELDLSNANDGAHPIDIDIEERIRHPNHKFKLVYDDIALIKLAKKVTEFTDQIRPACLWTSDRIKETAATASGWGKIGDGEERSLRLLKVGLNVYDRSVCEKNYAATRRMPEGMRDSMLCAGELKGGKDTCKGDSGGPLVISKEGNHCDYHIIGVVSFGKICGAKDLPGIYTKVSSYIPWIESIVWK